MKIRAYRKGSNRSGCLICGKPVVYGARSRTLTCEVCGFSYESNASCEDGHYVCDKCHTSAQDDFLNLIRNTGEKDPLKLFGQIVALPGVHMHGPEHHIIVPCVMLAAYRNNGGDIDINAAIKTASKRGGQIPGGVCGFWGACGGAIGAGIYASILTGSNPLNAAVWAVPQRLTAKCLERMAELGGPRCCKRSARIAIELAVEFTKEQFGIEIPLKRSLCGFYSGNRECLRMRCPYYGGFTDAEI